MAVGFTCYKKRRRSNKEEKKKHKIYLYVHGWLSATTLDLLFHMRACLRCLTLVDTDALLCMYLLLLLWCCCCFAVGCGVATIATITAALVHEGTEVTCTYRENENTAVQKKYRKQRKAGKVQRVIDGGGVQGGRPGRCQPTPLRKKIKVCLCTY